MSTGIPVATRAQVLRNSDTMLIILAACEIADLIRLSLVDRNMNEMVKLYMHNTYNMNHLLSRYFSDVEAFRTMQRQNATLISGEQALRFFDRTRDVGQPLDLFAFPGREYAIGTFLLADGYTCVLSDGQEIDFVEPNPGACDPKSPHSSYPRPFLRKSVWTLSYWEMICNEQNKSGIDSLYHFKKRSMQQIDKELRIRVFIASISPIASILWYYPSIALLNVISHDTAYSLYPKLTFAREQIPIDVPETTQDPHLQRYLACGWKETTRPSYLEFMPQVPRWINDKHSWIIPLSPTTYAQASNIKTGLSASDPTRQCFPDLTSVSGWLPWIRDEVNEPVMMYNVVSGDALKYNYTIPMTTRQLGLDEVTLGTELMTLWGRDIDTGSGHGFADEDVIKAIMHARQSSEKEEPVVSNLQKKCNIQ